MLLGNLYHRFIQQMAAIDTLYMERASVCYWVTTQGINLASLSLKIEVVAAIMLYR